MKIDHLIFAAFLLIPGQIFGQIDVTRSLFTPPVVSETQTDPVRFEVTVTGNPPSVVFEYDGADRPMFNDGTNGDQVAGDDTWTIMFTPSEILSKNTPSRVFRPFIGFVRVDGFGKLNVFGEIWTSEIGLREVRSINGGGQETDYIANYPATRSELMSFDPRVWAQRFYQTHGDDFDFLNFVLIPGRRGNRFHSSVKNTVQGIGLSIFDNTTAFGSAERLKGYNYYPIPSFFDGGEKAFAHETGHQWINFLTNTPYGSGRPHWPRGNIASNVMGFSIPPSGQGGDYPFTFTPNGSGGYVVGASDSIIRSTFNSMELYLMGLIPPGEVGDFFILTNQSQTITAGQTLLSSEVTPVSINSILASYGPRIPDATQSQKNFRVATIVISEQLLDERSMAFYDHFARRTEATTPLPFASGFSTGTTNPWFLATGGRSEMRSSLNDNPSQNPTPTPTPDPTPTPLPRTNFALASNGGVASASSEYPGFPALATNNGDRKGVDWGNGGIWNDDSRNVYPDFLQIDLAGTKTIDEIDVFAVQDNFQNPSEPTLSDIFTQYGVTSFEIQYWNGSAWVTVPGGSITANSKVWSHVTFPAVTTDKIRIVINNGLQNYSRLAEVEAWGGGNSPTPDPTPTPTPAPPAAITVTNTSDSGAGSLRQAIADVAAGGTISFDPSVFSSSQTITLTSGQLVIDKSLTIQGPGQSLLSISGNSASRVFYINSGVMVTLDGITIRDGAFSYPGGGGIWNDGAVTVSDSTITGNTGFYGGGIFNGALSTLSVINSTISDNSATGGCGGGECASGGGISNEGTTTVSNSTISGNTTGPCDIICPAGGGIYSTGDLLTVTNSTISGNSTGGIGGGIWAGRFIVTNSTISSNTASVGGGIFSVDAVNVVGDLVVNTIVAGNSALSGGEIGGTIESANHNLIGDAASSGGITNGVNGNIVGVNPLLGPLQKNGGLTLTHALLTGSPAINAGNNCVLSENGCGDGNPALPFDQRSFGRVGSVDIGAFEMQATRTRRRRR